MDKAGFSQVSFEGLQDLGGYYSCQGKDSKREKMCSIQLSISMSVSGDASSLNSLP